MGGGLKNVKKLNYCAVFCIILCLFVKLLT